VCCKKGPDIGAFLFMHFDLAGSRRAGLIGTR
jgi:hypothetical protein